MPFNAQELQDIRNYIEMGGRCMLMMKEGGEAKSNTNISYGKDDGLEGGTGAELAWVICTDPKTSNEEIENQKKLLKEYCAKDTFALHDIVKYLIQKYEQELKL